MQGQKDTESGVYKVKEVSGRVGGNTGSERYRVKGVQSPRDAELEGYKGRGVLG